MSIGICVECDVVIVSIVLDDGRGERVEGGRVESTREAARGLQHVQLLWSELAAARDGGSVEARTRCAAVRYPMSTAATTAAAAAAATHVQRRAGSMHHAARHHWGPGCVLGHQSSQGYFRRMMHSSSSSSYDDDDPSHHPSLLHFHLLLLTAAAAAARTTRFGWVTPMDICSGGGSGGGSGVFLFLDFRLARRSGGDRRIGRSACRRQGPTAHFLRLGG